MNRLSTLLSILTAQLVILATLYAAIPNVSAFQMISLSLVSGIAATIITAAAQSTRIRIQ